MPKGRKKASMSDNSKAPENYSIFSAQELRKISKISMKTGLTKKKKVTELYFNENNALIEVLPITQS